MAEVGNLTARLTADVSDFVRNLKTAQSEAATTTAGITRSLDEVRAARSIGEAFQSIGHDLRGAAEGAEVAARGIGTVTAAADEAAASVEELKTEFARGLFEGIQAEASEAVTSLKSVGNAGAEVAADMQAAVASISAAQRSIGAGLAPATGGANFGRVSAEVSQLTANLTNMARAGEVSALGVQQVAINVAQLAQASGASGAGVASLVTGLVGFVAAGGVVVGIGKAIAQQFKEMADAAKRSGDLAAFGVDSSKGIERMDAIVRSAVAATRSYTEETEALVAQLRAEGIAENAAAGAIEAKTAALRQAREETLFNQRIAEKNAAGARLDETIGDLREKLQVRPADDTLDALKQLKTELDFKGPLRELTALDEKLRDIEKTMRDAAKEALKGGAIFNPGQIERDIAEAKANLKEGFKADFELGLTLDPSKAQAEVDRFITSVSRGPGITITPEVDLRQALTQLDLLRAKILDTPEGELKIALKAKAEELEQKIADLRAAQEGAPITIPVDADTAAAKAKLDELKKAAADLEQERADFGGVSIGGDAASEAELTALAASFRQQVAEALKAGNVEGLADLQRNAQAFLNNFGDGLRQFGDDAARAAVFSIESTLNELFQRIGDLTREIGNSFRNLPPLTINVEATGSPTMPFTDYFTRHVPGLLADVSRVRPTIEFDADTERVRGVVDAATANLHAPMTLEADTSAFLRSVQGLTPSIKPSLEPTDFTRQLAETAAKVENLRVTVPLAADAREFDATVRRLEQTRPTINLDANAESVKRVADEATADLRARVTLEPSGLDDVRARIDRTFAEIQPSVKVRADLRAFAPDDQVADALKALRPTIPVRSELDSAPVDSKIREIETRRPRVKVEVDAEASELAGAPVERGAAIARALAPVALPSIEERLGGGFGAPIDLTETNRLLRDLLGRIGIGFQDLREGQDQTTVATATFARGLESGRFAANMADRIETHVARRTGNRNFRFHGR